MEIFISLIKDLVTPLLLSAKQLWIPIDRLKPCPVIFVLQTWNQQFCLSRYDRKDMPFNKHHCVISLWSKVYWGFYSCVKGPPLNLPLSGAVLNHRAAMQPWDLSDNEYTLVDWLLVFMKRKFRLRNDDFSPKFTIIRSCFLICRWKVYLSISLLALRCHFFPLLSTKLADVGILDLRAASKIVCPNKSRILSCDISTTKYTKMSGQYSFSARPLKLN